MLSPFISILLLAHLRVEGVPQAVTQEVEADHQEAEDEGRQPQQVRVEPQLCRPVAYQGTQRRLGHLDPQAYEAQERLRENCCCIVNIRFITMSPSELGIRCFHTSLNPLAPKE